MDKSSAITISPKRTKDDDLCQCLCGGSPRLDRDFLKGFMVYCPRCHRHTEDAPRAIHESEAIAEWEVDICKKSRYKESAMNQNEMTLYDLQDGWSLSPRFVNGISFILTRNGLYKRNPYGSETFREIRMRDVKLELGLVNAPQEVQDAFDYFTCPL